MSVSVCDKCTQTDTQWYFNRVYVDCEYYLLWILPEKSLNTLLDRKVKIKETNCIKIFVRNV